MRSMTLYLLKGLYILCFCKLKLLLNTLCGVKLFDLALIQPISSYFFNWFMQNISEIVLNIPIVLAKIYVKCSITAQFVAQYQYPL